MSSGVCVPEEQGECAGAKAGAASPQLDAAWLARQEPLYNVLGIEPGKGTVCDLHSHTVLSDGSDTFPELMGKARVRGVGCLAVTNHDTTVGLDAIAAYARAHAFNVVCGVEISAWDPKAEARVHIVGLGMREHSPAVAALCSDTLRRRTANTVWQMERLVEAGFVMDVDAAARYAAASTGFYKQHLMAALTGARFESAEYQLLYRSLFKNGGIAQRDIAYPDARDAVRAIREDGGLPVLAHPGQFNNYDMVPALVDAGLAGIEKFHPDHDYTDTKRVEELACRFNLFCSGGSDYHGAFGRPPHPGFRAVVF